MVIVFLLHKKLNIILDELRQMISENEMGLHVKGLGSKKCFLPWQAGTRQVGTQVGRLGGWLGGWESALKWCNPIQHVPPLQLSPYISFKIALRKFIRRGFQQKEEDVGKLPNDKSYQIASML